MDPGFILDEASGLYFHAVSGFYHDPSAGWYYNTHDGVYYKYDEGTYVPIATESSSGNAASFETCSTSPDECLPGVSNSHKSGLSETTIKVADETVGDRESTEVDDQLPRDTSNGNLIDVQGDMSSLEFEIQPWYFDSLRSIYWYYDKETRAYYKYHEELYKETVVEKECATDGGLLQPDDTGGVHEDGKACSVSGKASKMQDTSDDTDDVNNSELSAGWVEETLINLYLRGYPHESIDKDDGQWITSADIFLEDSSTKSLDVDTRYMERTDNRNGLPTGQELPYPGFIHNFSEEQASFDESDEGSEDLEEGEWVPDEPLQIVDETLYREDCKLHTDAKVNGDRHTWESFSLEQDSYNNATSNEGLEKGEVEDGNEFSAEENEYVKSKDDQQLVEDVKSKDDQQLVEELWHAQFGQVAVRERAREHAIPGAIDLWDWMIAEIEPNPLKVGKPVKKLVGRIASSATKLLSGSSGVIRTSAIRAAKLDFVEVSSGKIYRLRRPSMKHVSSLGNYNSSNPTKDWGFPLLEHSLVNIIEGESSDSRTATHDTTECQTGALLSKPFVPNTGHWQFQRLTSTKTKKGKTVPAALLASKYLSPEEILMNEERKQKYRDRAAERRTLHGGFGTGPGQKVLTPHEQDELDADNAVQMEGALKNAAAAPRLGTDNIGKRMLKCMGWKEGQTLGVAGGLIDPLQVKGNHGCAGLGWR